MKAKSAKHVVKVIGNKHLNLYPDKDYWYFTYDDSPRVFETHSVLVPRLSDQTLEEWVDEGRAFCRAVESGNWRDALGVRGFDR